jgi:hypothetical protein
VHRRFQRISCSRIARALSSPSDPKPSEPNVLVPVARLFFLTSTLTFQHTAVLHADFPPTAALSASRRFSRPSSPSISFGRADRAFCRRRRSVIVSLHSAVMH